MPGKTKYRTTCLVKTRLAPASLTLALFVLQWLPGAVAADDAPKAPAGFDQDITETDPTAAAEREARLITGVRQLTFEGRRAGEGYFSKDGSLMVFQSERERGNPFFQIYLMDLEFGDIERISPGHGKTTCAWIHPDANQVLFASTHDDPQARAKQAEEIRLRESGRQRRYSWDYDEHYEIYIYDRQAKKYTNVTNVRGYDAEGSFSPDGRLIAFASNRRAYSEQLSAEERKMFEHDPATMMDIYICNADGSNVRRLTTKPGYDGGPFFSPDGSRICWRHFTTDGAIAEIMTMNIDGTDKRQLTKIGAMS
jgi:Tol biopolymer transport system component